MTTKTIGIITLLTSLIVLVAEIGYYVGHPYRPGVSPHLIALSAAVALQAVVIIGLKSSKE